MRTLPARAARALAAGVWLGAAAVAQAAPATYVCEDRQLLKVSSTPFSVKVEVGAERWSATRARDAQDAHFVNKRDKVRVLLNRSDLELQRPAGTLRCKLLPRGMAPENLYVAPAASAAER